MTNALVPDFKSEDSEVYRLYLYVEQLRMETESRLSYIENQLAVIKQLLTQTD